MLPLSIPVRSRRPLAVMLIACLPSLARAGDWYVDDDGSCAGADGSANNPFCEIQDAVAAAAAGDSIHVAAGEYAQAVVIDRDLTVIGVEGRGVTLLRATANERGVTVLAGVTVSIEELSILGSGTPFDKDRDGGVMVETGSTATLVRCTVAGHYQGKKDWLGGRGAGIDNSGTLDLIDCVVRDNWTVSVLADVYTGPGGGIYNRGILTLVETSVRGNWCGDSGAGLYNAGSATLLRSSFTGNTAYDPCGFGPCWAMGGGIFSTGSLVLDNCIVSGNSGTFGAGLSSWGSTTLSSCTVTQNSSPAAGYGYGIHVREGATALDHTIVASNSGPDVCGVMSSVGYNLVQDTSCATITGPGTGDLYGIDPLFANPNGPDWALREDSPCVDAGDPQEQPTGSDFAGNPRLLDGNKDGVSVIDMGAYEFVPLGCAITWYCGPGQNPHNAALIDIDTCYSASSSIHVRLAGGPPGQFAYLLVGDAGGTISQPPGATGDLCVAGGTCLGRYTQDAGAISAAGAFSTDVQNPISNPCGGAVVLAPGTTWHFQFWHRRPDNAPSTFSGALQVTFE